VNVCVSDKKHLFIPFTVKKLSDKMFEENLNVLHNLNSTCRAR